MRHRHGYRKLGRTSAHRAALLKNMSIALIENKGDANAHRAVFASLQSKEAVKKLMNEVAPEYKERNGGYTRIIKTRTRRGDAAPMAFIELV